MISGDVRKSRKIRMVSIFLMDLRMDVYEQTAEIIQNA
jgi:hypothetical protein